MPLALPLLIPFAEIAGIAIGAVTTGVGLKALSDKVEDYIEDNPEQAQKIFAMIMPEQGLASIFNTEADDGEEVSEEELGEIETDPRSTKEIVLEEVARGRGKKGLPARGNFSSKGAVDGAVSITGNVKRGLRDAGRIRQGNDPNYDASKKFQGFKKFANKYKKKYADGGMMEYANGGGVGSMMEPKSKTGKAVNELQAKAPEGEFLAYINPDEAAMLKRAGGSGEPVNGIPSFRPQDRGNAANQAASAANTGSGGGSRSNNNNNNNNNDGPRGPQELGTSTRTVNRITAPEAYEIIGGQRFNVNPNTTDERNRARVKQEILNAPLGNRNSINKTGIFSGGFNPFSLIAGIFGGPLAGLLTRGIMKGKDKVGDLFGNFNKTMRGTNPDGTTRTQAEYEQARYDRQQVGRLDKLYAAKDRGYNTLTPFGKFKTTDFTPGQQSKIDMLEQNYDPTTARNVDSARGSGLRNTLAANNMTSQLFDPKEIQSLIDNKAALTSNATPYTMGSVPFSPALGNTQPQKMDMMTEYFNSIDNKATGPNIVQNASEIAQQAKTFNTTDALNNLGNTTEKGFFGTSLTDQGKGLESFRNSAVNFYNSPNNTNKTAQSALNFMSDRPGLYGDVIENKDFIQNAINQGFLQTEDDYKNQESLENFI